MIQFLSTQCQFHRSKKFSLQIPTSKSFFFFATICAYISSSSQLWHASAIIVSGICDMMVTITMKYSGCRWSDTYMLPLIKLASMIGIIPHFSIFLCDRLYGYFHTL